MPDRLDIFVDEAGDPTLFGRKRGSGPIVGNSGCSNFFIMGKLEVADPDELADKMTSLRRKLLADPYFAGVESFKPERRKTALGLHANDDLPEVRRELMKLLREEAGKLRFHAVVADKHKLAAHEVKRRLEDPKARFNPNSLYDDLIRSLFGKLHRIADEYHVRIARRGKSDRNTALRQALDHAENDFERKFGFRRADADDWKIEISDPHRDVCLQAVDYFLWAVQRFYEPRTHPGTGEIIHEDRFLKMLWPQIGELHDLHFGPSTGTFFTGEAIPTVEARFPDHA